MRNSHFVYPLLPLSNVQILCGIAAAAPPAQPETAPQPNEIAVFPDYLPAGELRVGDRTTSVYRFSRGINVPPGYAYEPLYDLNIVLLPEVARFQFTLTRHTLSDTEIALNRKLLFPDGGEEAANFNPVPLIPKDGRTVVSLQTAAGDIIDIARGTIITRDLIVFTATPVSLGAKPIAGIDEIVRLGLVIRLRDVFDFTSTSSNVSKLSIASNIATTIREKVSGNAKRLEMLAPTSVDGIQNPEDVFVERQILQETLGTIDTKVEVQLSGIQDTDSKILSSFDSVLKKVTDKEMSMKTLLDTIDRTANVGYVLDTEAGKLELSPEIFESTLREYKEDTSTSERRKALKKAYSEFKKEVKNKEQLYNYLKKNSKGSGSASASASVIDFFEADGDASMSYETDYTSLDTNSKEYIENLFSKTDQMSEDEFEKKVDRSIEHKGNTYVLKRQPRSLKFSRVVASKFREDLTLAIRSVPSRTSFERPRSHLLKVGVGSLIERLRALYSLAQVTNEKAHVFSELQDGSFVLYLYEKDKKWLSDSVVRRIQEMDLSFSRVEVNLNPNDPQITDAALAEFIRVKGDSLKEIYLSGCGPKAANEALNRSRQFVGLFNVRFGNELVKGPEGVQIKKIGVGEGLSDETIGGIVTGCGSGLEIFSTWNAQIGQKTKAVLENLVELREVHLTTLSPVSVEFVRSLQLGKCEILKLTIDRTDLGKPIDRLTVDELKSNMPKLKEIVFLR